MTEPASALFATAILLRGDPEFESFVVGAAALGLLFIGIHNAWDSVTHIVVSTLDGGAKKRGG